MLLLFLFIKIFFAPALCSLRCIGGPHCHIKLHFNQIIPPNQQLLETCTIIEFLSCSVYLKIDYADQQVDILFDNALNNTESVYPFIDLLTSNPQASIVLRYTVKVSFHDNWKIQLYVLLQCRTIDQCTEQQLRHFWPRFISLKERENSFIRFFQLLHSITSNVSSCFDDRTNQIEQCSTSDNICWASTNSTERKCIKYDRNDSNDFIYSYNKVERPHRLTDENVHYTLACRINNCNNNKTINELSTVARQFAENSWPMNKSTAEKESHDKKQLSFAIKLISSYFDTFCFFRYSLYATSFEKDDDIVQVVSECRMKTNGYSNYPCTVSTYRPRPGDDLNTQC